MKFTSEDLMKAMGLQVGDRVKITFVDNTFIATDKIYEIKQNAGNTYMQIIDNGFIDSLAYLIDQDYEILPRPKRVGNLTCKDVSVESCNKCPIRFICNVELTSDTTPFYEILEDFKYDTIFDQEIYGLLKARLDKEVE